jgi:hypothetical protein
MTASPKREEPPEGGPWNVCHVCSSCRVVVSGRGHLRIHSLRSFSAPQATSISSPRPSPRLPLLPQPTLPRRALAHSCTGLRPALNQPEHHPRNHARPPQRAVRGTGIRPQRPHTHRREASSGVSSDRCTVASATTSSLGFCIAVSAISVTSQDRCRSLRWDVARRESSEIQKETPPAPLCSL